MLWSNEYLSRLELEAEVEISRELQCITGRIALATMIGQSEYLLPEYIFNVKKVYWRGKRLEPICTKLLGEFGYDILEFEEGAFLGTAFSDAFNIGRNNVTHVPSGMAIGGEPCYYFYYGFGENIIRLNPPADEVLVPETNGLWAEKIKDTLIVEFYRFADGVNWKLPDYIRQRTIKHYVLWKAFLRESDGQNLNASEFHHQRYLVQLNRARKLIDGVYRAKINVAPAYASNEYNYPGRRYNFDGDYGYQGRNEIPRPVLPYNYGVVVEDEEIE